MSEGEKGADGRRNPRFDVENLDGRLAFNLGAEVINISPAGMCVRTTSPLVVHRTYDISLRSADESLKLRGTVRWCTLRSTRRTVLNEVEPLYEAGIAFEGVLAEAAMPFIEFLRHNVIVNLAEDSSETQRLFGRFELGESEVSLEGAGRFEVRRLSLSGMLARSSAILPRETRCELRFELDGCPVAARARVVHCSEVADSDGEPRYDLGIEFLDLDDSAHEALDDFINRVLDA